MNRQHPDQPPTVWQTVKRSALTRLGKPLLLAYLALAILGAIGVLVSLAWMRFG